MTRSVVSTSTAQTGGTSGKGGAAAARVAAFEKVAPWTSRLVWLLGLTTILGALYPSLRPRLEVLIEVLPPAVAAFAPASMAPLGLVLLALARGLRRRKRRAWQFAVLTSCVLLSIHLLARHDVEESILTGAVLAMLLASRRAFAGAPEPRSGRQVLAVGAGSFAVATLVGAALILLDPDQIVGALSPSKLLEHILWGLGGVDGPLRFSTAAAQTQTSTTLLLLGAAVAGATLAAALRPARGPHTLRPVETARMRALLTGHGASDSFGYFSLRQDKSVIFSASGKAAVAFRVIAGVSLASGDPLGDNEAWPGAIQAWLDQAATYAWTPAVLGASETGATAYRRHGLDVIELGDEAIVNVADFTLAERPMRAVRQGVARARRAGYRVQIARMNDLDHDRTQQLSELADTWRGGQAERGFSMALGRFGDPSDAQCVVVTCTDRAGQVKAMLSLVPWGTDGLSLDLMRRSPEIENGAVELMVTQLLEQAPALGVTQVSLNFAVFRSVFERGGKLGAGPILRLWHHILMIASKFWQIESLYRANAKYRPIWAPRYLCFARARELPQIGAAALEAEAFWRRPRWLGGQQRSGSRSGNTDKTRPSLHGEPATLKDRSGNAPRWP